ncbi:MAG: hypothetical protein KDJ80_15735 [Nitratireductor sp.]|nr:hypothetical protein [Nitratireductor sp.]
MERFDKRQNRTCQYWPHQISIDREPLPVSDTALGLQIGAYRFVCLVGFVFGGSWIAPVASALSRLFRAVGWMGIGKSAQAR